MVSTGVSPPAAVTVVLPLRTESREPLPDARLFPPDMPPITPFFLGALKDEFEDLI